MNDFITLDDTKEILEKIYDAQHTAGYYKAVMRCAYNMPEGILFTAGQWVNAVTDEQLDELLQDMMILAEGNQGQEEFDIAIANLEGTCLVLGLAQNGYIPLKLPEDLLVTAVKKLGILVITESQRRKGADISADVYSHLTVFKNEELR